ncbi:hypothetical protein HPB48_005635 [Haemaphysalis longicornis]|uniref:Uncharacterized protein n=1 Tax=Haemaphysalis longicornis TaxID=44386 RepID=A0A9J6G7A9_HAELO|nr:hypothetical protein HPB48_005635 [Haemaphysalis longicornis]
MLTPEDLTWFERAVLPLDLPHRVSHFQLGLREVDPRQETVYAIAEFIETSNTLSRLVLDFRQWDIDPETSSMSEFRRTILKAVHRNTSIQYLALWYDDCPSPDAEELACTVGESKTMCYLDLDLGPSAGSVFLSRLLSIIWHNYTVISAYMEGIPDAGKLLYDNLLSVLTRNWRLVGRAAKLRGRKLKPILRRIYRICVVQPGIGQGIVRTCIRGRDGSFQNDQRKSQRTSGHGRLHADLRNCRTTGRVPHEHQRRPSTGRRRRVLLAQREEVPTTGRHSKVNHFAEVF